MDGDVESPTRMGQFDEKEPDRRTYSEVESPTPLVGLQGDRRLPGGGDVFPS